MTDTNDVSGANESSPSTGASPAVSAPVEPSLGIASRDGKSSGPSSVLPAISLPRGGGAIRGIGEKFSANPVNGTGSFTVPIAASQGRGALSPLLELQYDSGAGNGVFGWGFRLSAPSITRRTDKGLPLYQDDDETDTFVLSGSEDLVPVLVGNDRHRETRTLADGTTYVVRRYRPRIEAPFSRVERWTHSETRISHFRTINKDNVVTLFGYSESARIADPNDATRVFAWLVEESRDDRGNVISYVYKPEDEKGVDSTVIHERNRLAHAVAHANAFANRHIKRVRYGNRVPGQTDAWLFELVFDYGEHDEAAPKPAEDRPWTVREDPFSNYRAGFEVRTYRRCRRALMFHLFPRELGADATLVRSTDFEYGASAVASFLKGITPRGYVRNDDGSYQSQSMPSLDLAYSEPSIDETVHSVDPASLENLPVGLGAGYQWVDLYKEGLPGILSQQAGAWFYKPNEGNATFGPAQVLAETPLADLQRQQILDLDADARNELVRFYRPGPGFHPQRDDGTWGAFVPFAATPNIDWNDPNVRFIELTGDGRPDILLTENEVFTWYPSLGSEGFGAGARVAAAFDEEVGPRLVFSRHDEREAIYLADMSGDGLADLVRIRNGEVCYWPNLGYGKFGSKVCMSASPVFDGDDVFRHKRIRLADVDGSGTTDIIYLGPQKVSIFFNQSGNSLSEPRVLTELPPVDDSTSVAAIDLLGNGTMCLVFSSALPANAPLAMTYVDLMGGAKPHLLTSVKNNLGAETHVRYVASTQFYLADKRAGTPWITKTPFPVHVVERVETLDRINQNRFVTRYAYHHGHYDGIDREFRGFGLVEEWDTEELSTLQAGDILPSSPNEDASSHVPPVRIKTWFHTGAYREGGAVSQQFAKEYWRKYGQGDADFQALLLDDTPLPLALTYEEEREACRALKGSMLRREVFADDGSDKAALPYVVSEHNYTIETIQPRGVNRYAAFLTHTRESISYYYERNPDDPRSLHEVTLEVDAYGGVRRSAKLAYGRDPAHALAGSDGSKQTQTLATYAETDFTNAIDLADAYRTPLPAEKRRYELTGLPTGKRPSFDAIDEATKNAVTIAYEQAPTTGAQKRILGLERILYRSDKLDKELPLGALESYAFPYETYKLSLTSGLVAQVFAARVTPAMLAAGAYVSSQGDSNAWIPSGRLYYSPGESDDAATELAFGRQHFFQPRRTTDAFGQSSSVTYDAYDLLPRELKDALGNLTTADLDYRVLAPWRLLDANRNRTAVKFDAFGFVVATAVMGKEGEGVGDTLDDPTIRIEYDVLAFRDRGEPVVIHTYAREEHGATNPRWQETYSYCDGFGREVQKKVQAESGPVVSGGPTVKSRWVGTGWSVFNNKGKAVRRYEPFFSATAAFELAKKVGVSNIQIYDPLLRLVATIRPNRTYEKFVFDGWLQTAWDVNDTVLLDPKTDPDVGGYFRRLPDEDYLPTWYADRKGGALGAQEKSAADKAAAHANTPSVTHLDSLGRPFLVFVDDGVAKYATRFDVDIQGRQRQVGDAHDRVVMRHDYDLLGTRIHQASMESGERWMLDDVSGHPIYGWDSREHAVRSEYDELRRPRKTFLSEGGGTEILVHETVYGESQASPEDRNLRNATYQVLDDAGVVTNEEYDFKSNLLRWTRQFAVQYNGRLDWSSSVPLETEAWGTSSTFDALNRPTSVTTPDNSVVRPKYNEANFLESLDARLAGAGSTTSFVTNIDYNARGQRELVEFANGVSTTYSYDPSTFRLSRVRTKRGADTLQDLSYTYDPFGNVTYLRDAAQQTIYFANQRVEPSADYTYDPLYRLIAATGREHLGQTVSPPSPTDSPRVGLAHPGDGRAMGRYVQTYVYDEVGNILEMAHRGTDPANPGWTRTYAYEEASLLEPSKPSNRLSRTTVDGNTAVYGYDAHGNAVAMPHLSVIEWDYRDHLSRSARQVVSSGTPESTYYVYDHRGQRVRKVTELSSGVRKDERLYLGSFEMYRRYASDGATADLERQTLHVMAAKDRVALVETRTAGSDGSPPTLIRFQLGNHLGSAILELDEQAKIISYEEYYPFGSTSYQAVRSATEAPKRYRYSGKERDEENGFYYHGARYYAPWLARWTSADPAGLVDGPNLYRYARDNPIAMNDPSGNQPAPQLDPQTVETVKTALQAAAAAWGSAAVYTGGAAATTAEVAAPAAAAGTLVGAGAAAAAGLVFAGAFLGATIIAVNLWMERSASIVKYGNPWGLSSQDAAFPVLKYTQPPAVDPTTIPNAYPLPQPLPAEDKKPRPELPGRIYVTYTKYNSKTGLYYSGRTSMVIDLNKPWEPQARAAVAARDANHHVDENDEPGDPAFEDAKIDKFFVGYAVSYNNRYRDFGYWAIRGREQQLIDFYGAKKAKELGLTTPFKGGAQSDTKPGANLTENAVRGVGKDNVKGQIFHEASNLAFQGELAPYTGNVRFR